MSQTPLVVIEKVEIHNHYNVDVTEIEKSLTIIIQKLNTMPTKADFDAAFATINEATNNIAADITKLSQQIAGGLSADDATAVVAQLNDVATKLQGIAAVTPE